MTPSTMTHILALFAHPDDEALACGGTLATLSAKHDITIVFANDGIPRRGDAFDYDLRAEAAQAAHTIGAKAVHFLGFLDQQLDAVACALIVDRLRALALPPCEYIFTHRLGDCNTDHDAVHRAALVYARPTVEHRVRLLVGCEVASSSEWGTQPFAPNWWMPLSFQAMDAKDAALHCYAKEMRDLPHPRSYDAVWDKAMVRGAECCANYAEAFQILRCTGEIP